MTELEQSMADILSRMDITLSQKVKLFEDSLHRFRNVREEILRNGSTLQSSEVDSPIKQFMHFLESKLNELNPTAAAAVVAPNILNAAAAATGDDISIQPAAAAAFIDDIVATPKIRKRKKSKVTEKKITPVKDEYVEFINFAAEKNPEMSYDSAGYSVKNKLVANELLNQAMDHIINGTPANQTIHKLSQRLLAGVKNSPTRFKDFKKQFPALEAYNKNTRSSTQHGQGYGVDFNKWNKYNYRRRRHFKKK